MSDFEDDSVVDTVVDQIRDVPGVNANVDASNNCCRLNQEMHPLNSSLDARTIITRLQCITLSKFLKEDEMEYI
eukprot:10830661-Ditylum_brightwellii.AAC.1